MVFQCWCGVFVCMKSQSSLQRAPGSTYLQRSVSICLLRLEHSLEGLAIIGELCGLEELSLAHMEIWIGNNV